MRILRRCTRTVVTRIDINDVHPLMEIVGADVNALVERVSLAFVLVFEITCFESPVYIIDLRFAFTPRPLHLVLMALSRSCVVSGIVSALLNM